MHVSQKALHLLAWNLYGIMTEELVIREIRIDEAVGRGDSDSRMMSFEVIIPRKLQSTNILKFKLSVLKKTRIWMPFNVLIYLGDALLFQNKENKILFGPPPQKKGSRIRTVVICLQAQVFVYTISP